MGERVRYAKMRTDDLFVLVDYATSELNKNGFMMPTEQRDRLRVTLQRVANLFGTHNLIYRMCMGALRHDWKRRKRWQAGDDIDAIREDRP